MWPPPLAQNPCQPQPQDQQQYNQQLVQPQNVPQPMPPAGGPKKRAFICGINYTGTANRLNGCINDAKCMQYLLTSKFGFQDSNILIMTDDNPNPTMRPTRYNMTNGFTWLMTGLQAGDSLVFHYSGHGGQERDRSGEELDGMNETLCPLDFQSAGQIEDNEVNKRIVNPLPTGVKLHAIIDACHSGSVLDLPYQAVIRGGRANWQAAYAGRTRDFKGTGGGFAVQFSAASDHQVAADTSKLSGGVATGAATFCFIKAVEEKGINLPYGELLLSMNRTLQSAGLGSAAAGNGGGNPYQGGGDPFMMGGGGGDPLGGMLAALLGSAGGGANFQGQEPVLSANYSFDLSAQFSL